MEFMRITSAANPSIKLAKNLAQHSRAARKEGLSLAEGIHLARELLSHPELVRKVFLREGAEKNFEISEILQKYLSLSLIHISRKRERSKKTRIGFILTASKIRAMSEPSFVPHWLPV